LLKRTIKVFRVFTANCCIDYECDNYKTMRSKTAGDVKHCVELVRLILKVQAILDSVESSVEWLQHPTPNLNYFRYPVGDGLAFDILKKIRVYVSNNFCTAYNEICDTSFSKIMN